MPAQKKEIIEQFRTHESDTGSVEIQVALLTERINRLTEHLRIHRQDLHSQRGLMKLVGKRKRLLSYLNQNTPERYQTLIARLGLRK